MRYTVEYSPDFFDENDQLVHPAELDLLAIETRTNIVLHGTQAEVMMHNDCFTDDDRTALQAGYNVEIDATLYPAWETTFNGQILD